MLTIIFSTFLLFTIVMCFVRIEIGISMFLFYSILVPFLKFFSLGQNIFTLLMLLALLVNYNYKTLIFKPLKPFLFLYIAQFIIIPFHNDVTYDFQLNMIRIDFMRTILLPFIMINVMNRDPKAISIFTNTILVAIVLASIYTILLTKLYGINPYLMTILPLSGEEFNEGYALAENGGRMFGRISGVFPHPMTNGLFLSLASLFIFTLIDIDNLRKNILNIILFLIVVVSIMVMGVRTAIGALVVGFSILFYYEKRFKNVYSILIIIAIVFVIIHQIPGMDRYLSSIVDTESTEVKGSSIELRFIQLQGGLDAISQNYLFGKGFNWTGFYNTVHGEHPVMLGFESLLLVILCNNGFIGIIIWIVMLFQYLKLIIQNFDLKNIAIMLALVAIYLVYSIITGEYGYMKYFLIFYVIIWAKGKEIVGGAKAAFVN